MRFRPRPWALAPPAPHLKLMALGLAVGVVLWGAVFTLRYYKGRPGDEGHGGVRRGAAPGGRGPRPHHRADAEEKEDPGRVRRSRPRRSAPRRSWPRSTRPRRAAAPSPPTRSCCAPRPLFELGKIDEAQAAYKAFLDKSKSSPLRFVALEGLGYTLEAKGDLDGALARFSEMDPDPAKPGSGLGEERALWHQGRIYTAKGDKAKAVEALKKLVADYPTSALKASAEDRLAALEST